MPEISFLTGLFAAQETEGERDERDMMMPAEPAAAFEVIEAEFGFEFAAGLLGLPATARGMYGRAQGRGPRPWTGSTASSSRRAGSHRPATRATAIPALWAVARAVVASSREPPKP